MFRRMLLIAALVLAAGGVVAVSPAGAQNYGGCTATVSDTTPTPGQVVTVSGTGAANGGTVTASLDDATVGTGTADSAGEFSFSATIPTTASGSKTLDVDCGATVDSVTITVGAATGSGGLPETGSDSLPLTVLALGALAIGGVVLAGARMRSKSASL